MIMAISITAGHKNNRQKGFPSPETCTYCTLTSIEHAYEQIHDLVKK